MAKKTLLKTIFPDITEYSIWRSIWIENASVLLNLWLWNLLQNALDCFQII